MSRPRPINYYDILGVASDATPREIRSAYVARIAQYHPDRNPTTHATAIAALVNEAWAVLGDADRRREYDASAGLGRHSAAAADAPHAGAARRPAPDPPRPSARQSDEAEQRARTAHVDPSSAEAPKTRPVDHGSTDAAGKGATTVDAAARSEAPAAREGGFGGWLRVVRQTVSVATGNRRGAKRLKTLFTVSVSPTAAPASARSSERHTCLDLSPQGLAFTTNHAIAAGTSLGVSLELPDGHLQASCAVVRCEPLKVKDRWKVAIEFIGLSSADRRRIRKFVDDEARSRVG